MDKKKIRKQVFAGRRRLSQSELEEKSRVICEKIMETAAWKEAPCVYAYMDCKGEVCMRTLLEAAWAQGKRVAVPKVFGQEMRFFYISSYEEVAPGYYDIPEPVGGEEAFCETALMIMPGVAFDERLHRCGYGGGFYDRFLSIHKDLTTIAPAFDFQIVPEVPAEPFDLSPQMLVTETKCWSSVTILNSSHMIEEKGDTGSGRMTELGKSYRAEEILKKIKELEEAYPEHLHYRHVGCSHDGREIPGILLGESPKCLIVSGGVHGRESINPVLLLRMIEDYAMIRENEYRDPVLDSWQQLLMEYSIFFLPLMNPDGYETALFGFSELRDPQLRQHAQEAGIPYEEWKGNGKGVDINRNFPCKSFLPDQDRNEPASEPETRALIRIFEKYPESVGYLDFHSRGKIIYYYRSAMTRAYNRKGKRIAKHLQKVSSYMLGKRSEERKTKYDGGNSVNYYSEIYGKPALTVETVEDEAAFPLDAVLQKETYREIRWIPLVYLKNYMD